MILERIKAICKQKGITITELERLLEFGNGTMHKWETSQPSFDKVIKVAEYLNVSIDDLAKESNSLPSIETMEFAKVFDLLSDNQKSLVKCYISIIKNGNQTPAMCTTHNT